jgi:protein-tyrosine phosphatase
MAAAVLRRLVREAGLTDRISVDSAGTGGWHQGDPADHRTHDALHRHGYPADTDPARQWSVDDFATRDLIVALDRSHLRELRRLAPDDAARARIRLLRTFDTTAGGATATGLDSDVPDPYCGGPADFDRVFDLVERGCRGILAEIDDHFGVR